MKKIIATTVLILLIIIWLISCGIVFFIALELSLLDRSSVDASLKKAREYNWYNSILTWVPLVIGIIIFFILLVVTLGTILLDIPGYLILVYEFSVPICIVSFFITLAIGVLGGITAYYCGQSTTSDSFVEVCKFLSYFLAGIAILAIIILICFIVANVINFYEKDKKAKSNANNLNLEKQIYATNQRKKEKEYFESQYKIEAK